MANIYQRVTKCNNAQGRSAYITDEKRQEEIVLHKSDMKYDWKFYSDYEASHSNSDKNNNEAREYVIALPNDLYDDPDRLESVCDDLVYAVTGNNKDHHHDYEYAVHWNHNRTNLHVHILFSEREVVMEQQPKTYKKDIWMDKDTGKLAKKGAENAELVHRKGDIQYDKGGNIKYDGEPLTKKDERYVQRNFTTQVLPIRIQKVFEKYGYDLGIQNKDTPYLSQIKIGHGNDDFELYAKAHNEEVRAYNEAVKEHLEAVKQDDKPELYKNYCEIRKEIETEMREKNRIDKKITIAALQVIRNMTDYVKQEIEKIKREIEHSHVGESIYAAFKYIQENYERKETVTAIKESAIKQNKELDIEEEKIDSHIKNVEKKIEQSRKRTQKRTHGYDIDL